MEAVKTDLKTVVTHLDQSVATQGDISTSLTAIQANTADQFARMGSHILANGVTVKALTDSLSDIRAELTRLFGLIATDIAGRSASSTQQTVPTVIRDHPTIHNEEIPSQQNEGTQVDNPRSPQPKRNRDGDALTPETEAFTPDFPMDTSMDKTSSCLDMTFDDDDDITHDVEDTSVLDIT